MNVPDKLQNVQPQKTVTFKCIYTVAVKNARGCHWHHVCNKQSIRLSCY
uniref:Uncharacterized protein n=1 Tax=Anguilla anguilla TaxID=7936 RepID=A0A0E9XCK8_ANGAN